MFRSAAGFLTWKLATPLVVPQFAAQGPRQYDSDRQNRQRENGEEDRDSAHGWVSARPPRKATTTVAAMTSGCPLPRESSP